METQKPLDVRKVQVRLVGHERSEARGHHDSHHFASEPMSIEAPRVIAPSWETEFSLPVIFEPPSPPPAKRAGPPDEAET